MKQIQKNLKIKGMLKIMIFLCLFPLFVQALTILTSKDTDLRKKQGKIEGYIVIKNKTRKDILALGEHKLSKDKKSVLFTITHIKKNQDYHTLDNQPSVIKERKGKKKLAKGTKIILAGENENEISQILGMDKKSYRSSKSGSSAPNQSSNGNSSSNNSSSGSVAGNPFPPIAGSGGNSNNNNGVYFPPNNGGGDGSGGGSVILPPTGGGGNGGDGNNGVENNGGDQNYSSQYCKSPIRNGNEMILSVVDRDGQCIELMANRDDTKCQYRYDFNNGFAIKQTQFYYIDKENVQQNIGGCIDLEGNNFRFRLYTDDGKCKLQSTEDKGYGSGITHVFQTQILFRGADGLVHVAKDCSDYANVKEELINYEIDYSKQEVIRVVNQYYIDPITGEKVYISNGIQSQYKAKWKEFVCGKWEYNDSLLEAYKPTQIRAFDEIDSAYYNVTGCDYSTDQGKSGKITQKYTKDFIDIDSSNRVQGDLNTSPERGDSEEDRLQKEKLTMFEIKEQLYGWNTQSITVRCKTCGSCIWGLQPAGKHKKTYNSYFLNGEKVLARWKTQYKTTNKGITERYVRPRQDKDDDATYAGYKYYYISKAEKVIERIPVIVEIDEVGISQIQDYMKHYEITELIDKSNLNDETLILLNTQEYQNWKAQYYRPQKGNKCQRYSISNGIITHNSKYICEYLSTHNGSISCSNPNNYIIPNAIKNYRSPTSFFHLKTLEHSIIGKMPLNPNNFKQMKNKESK